MNVIKGLPKLAADKGYDIRNGCVFDDKIFDKYLVKGSYELRQGYGGGYTAIHLNKDSYIEIPVEWNNVETFTLAMWVYTVKDSDESMYSIMSFNTNDGWKNIYYYSYQECGRVKSSSTYDRTSSTGDKLYGKSGWNRLNVEVNPYGINWTWNENYWLGGVNFGAFNTINTIRIGPHIKTGKFFNDIVIDNLTLIYDEKYPYGSPYTYSIPTVNYRNISISNSNLYINNSVAYGIERSE